MGRIRHREPLGWWGNMTAVVFGNLVAWAIATAVVLILWIGACGLALSEAARTLDGTEGLR